MKKSISNNCLYSGLHLAIFTLPVTFLIGPDLFWFIFTLLMEPIIAYTAFNHSVRTLRLSAMTIILILAVKGLIKLFS